jgi:hypothetical protein
MSYLFEKTCEDLIQLLEEITALLEKQRREPTPVLMSRYDIANGLEPLFEPDHSGKDYISVYKDWRS